MGIKHRKRTGIPAGDPSGLVGGTNWIDDHDHVPVEVAMFLAAGNAGVAAVASAAANAEMWANGQADPEQDRPVASLAGAHDSRRHRARERRHCRDQALLHDDEHRDVVEHRPRLHHDEPRRRRGHGRHDLALGNIPVANVKGFWVRRTAANTSALSNYGVTIAIAGDTGSL